MNARISPRIRTAHTPPACVAVPSEEQVGYFKQTVRILDDVRPYFGAEPCAPANAHPLQRQLGRDLQIDGGIVVEDDGVEHASSLLIQSASLPAFCYQ